MSYSSEDALATIAKLTETGATQEDLLRAVVLALVDCTITLKATQLELIQIRRAASSGVVESSAINNQDE